MAYIEQRKILDLLSDNNKQIKFFIPSYQRGYKWTKEQVEYLLKDITNFNYNKEKDNVYCLQPVVVKKCKDNLYDYEVVDGQQRLTTIYLILCYFLNNQSEDIKDMETLYSIKYETRDKRNNTKCDSQTFLDYFKKYSNNEGEINKNYNKNIDYYNINNTYKIVTEFFSTEKDEKKFLDKFLNYTQIIWYEADYNEDSIEIFERLNIGKIPLTNAELIKALFLNSSNFINEEDYIVKNKIALEWDQMEKTLQNQQFWYFIYGEDYPLTTRINYIFELFYFLFDKKNEPYNNQFEKSHKILKNASFVTFNFFDDLIKEEQHNSESKCAIIEKIWIKIKKIFMLFSEWYNDIQFYHYIGFLINNKSAKIKKSNYEVIISLIKEWQLLCEDENGKSRNDFINYLKKQIIFILKSDLDLENTSFTSFKDKLERTVFDYEIYNEENKKEPVIPKTALRNVLLLHNIQTVINQNNNFTYNEEKYGDGIFYKFPFHLFQAEQWDIEHINPATPNELKNDKEDIVYLHSLLEVKSISNDKNLKKEIIELIDHLEKQKKDNKNNELTNEYAAIVEKIKEKDINDDLNEKERNMLGNFCLLDSNTNRGYGNAIFCVKRQWIIGKSQGIKYEFSAKSPYKSEETKKSEDKAFVSFVPPCTKNVFLKYYNTDANDMSKWNKEDAKSYKKDVIECIKKVYTESSNSKKEEQ